MGKGGKNTERYLNALILPTFSHTFVLKYVGSPVEVKDASVLQWLEYACQIKKSKIAQNG